MSADTILNEIIQWSQEDREKKTLLYTESEFEAKLRCAYQENFNNAMKMVKKKLCPEMPGSAIKFLYKIYLVPNRDYIKTILGG